MKKFLIILLLTFGITVLPTLFIDMDTSFLTKPALFPKEIVFPIVWSILYLLMTISVVLATKDDNKVYKIYFTQLIVNALWTVLFFGLKWYFISFIWIILLFILVCIMIYQMINKNKLAGILQIPYLIWLLFAMYLNLSIYLLN